MRAPGAVVQSDHRHAGRGGQVHHLVDLLGEDLAQGAAEHREVLAEDADPPAIDGPEAGDHAVGVGPVVLEAHAVGPVPGQHVELLEGALVQEVLDALAGGQLALGVLTLDGPRAPGVEGLVLAFGQVGQAFGHGVFHAGEANARRVGPEIRTATPPRPPAGSPIPPEWRRWPGISGGPPRRSGSRLPSGAGRLPPGPARLFKTIHGFVYSFRNCVGRDTGLPGPQRRPCGRHLGGSADTRLRPRVRGLAGPRAARTGAAAPPGTLRIPVAAAIVVPPGSRYH